MLRSSLSFVLLSLTLSTAALALGPCPTGEILGSAAKRSSDLVCTVPQVYGPGGLVGTNYAGLITGSYATGDVTASDPTGPNASAAVGGFAGQLVDSQVSQSFSTGSVNP